MRQRQTFNFNAWFIEDVQEPKNWWFKPAHMAGHAGSERLGCLMAVDGFRSAQFQYHRCFQCDLERYQERKERLPVSASHPCACNYKPEQAWQHSKRSCFSGTIPDKDPEKSLRIGTNTRCSVCTRRNSRRPGYSVDIPNTGSAKAGCAALRKGRTAHG